jgi:hypothetical protein
MALRTSELILVAALVLLPTAAHSQEDWGELSHSDTISTNAGDANAANRAMQTEDFWPPYLNQTHIHTDGTQMELVIKKFHKRHAADAQPPSTVINIGSPQQ